jgi:hypothetical protein
VKFRRLSLLPVTSQLESGAYQRSDGVWVIPRDEAVSSRIDIKPGQHVVFAGPTQNGKTELAFCLLEHTATPEVPAYVSVSKPKDPVTQKWGKRLGYRIIREFPPTPKVKELFKEGKPSGYLVWPDMRDFNNAIPNATELTKQLIHGTYADGAKGKKCILVLDDTVTKSKVLGLDNDMTMILTMSGAMGIGGWFFVQKPTGAGNTALWSFSQSDHLFIARDPDKRNRERYTEIGGFDSKEVDRITQSLEKYQFLYLERSHRYMCIIDSK